MIMGLMFISIAVAVACFLNGLFEESPDAGEDDDEEVESHAEKETRFQEMPITPILEGSRAKMCEHIIFRFGFNSFRGFPFF